MPILLILVHECQFLPVQGTTLIFTQNICEIGNKIYYNSTQSYIPSDSCWSNEPRHKASSTIMTDTVFIHNLMNYSVSGRLSASFNTALINTVTHQARTQLPDRISSVRNQSWHKLHLYFQNMNNNYTHAQQISITTLDK